MWVIRLIALPFRLAWAVVVGVVRAALRFALLPLRLMTRGARLFGWRAYLGFAVGLAVGILFAPGPGKVLRDRLRALVAGGVITDDELRAKVAFELAHAPRTWHLAQPDVAVHEARVTLTGDAPDLEARDELVRVAGGIPGVAGVEDRIAVGEPV